MDPSLTSGKTLNGYPYFSTAGDETSGTLTDDKTPLATAPSAVSVPDRKGNGTVPKCGTQLISDGKAPLASVPKTGDGLPAVLLAAAASLSGIAALLFTGRRKRNV